METDFTSYLETQGKAENTVLAYTYAVAAYGVWYRDSCGMELQQLYRANILDYISFLRTVKGVSNRTVNAKLSALISYNAFLIETGNQKEQVLSKRDFLKVQQNYANPSTLSKQQVEEFRQRILVERGKRDYAIITILAYAGLRISEALSLEIDKISLTAREVRICGKGDKERIVFLNDKIVNAVQEYLKERPTSIDCPYLFVSRKGGRLDRSAVNRIFNKCSDCITPHTLRHFFCSEAIEVGYSMAEVANQAGHSNIHTTMIYTNPTRQKMKEKANQL